MNLNSTSLRTLFTKTYWLIFKGKGKIVKLVNEALIILRLKGSGIYLIEDVKIIKKDMSFNLKYFSILKFLSSQPVCKETLRCNTTMRWYNIN